MMHRTDHLSPIHRLMDEVEEAAASSRNRAREDRAPTGIFGMEEPIAWIKIFGYNLERYFADPQTTVSLKVFLLGNTRGYCYRHYQQIHEDKGDYSPP